MKPDVVGRVAPATLCSEVKKPKGNKGGVSCILPLIVTPHTKSFLLLLLRLPEVAAEAARLPLLLPNSTKPRGEAKLKLTLDVHWTESSFARLEPPRRHAYILDVSICIICV